MSVSSDMLSAICEKLKVYSSCLYVLTAITLAYTLDFGNVICLEISCGV